jgi:thymidylate synthase (FAD)
MSEASEDDKEFIKNMSESPEALMVYTARVSSPKQKNPSYDKLLGYCLEHQHWSVFEMIDTTVEITTNVAIAAQLLRHKSSSFQQHSRRYSSDDLTFEMCELRGQDKKNRQNSLQGIFSKEDELLFQADQQEIWDLAKKKYDYWLDKGAAKECVRFLLPQNTTTRMYMKAPLRTWITYVNVRTDPSTQKEHRLVAEKIKELLSNKFPVTAKAAGWL